MVARLCSLCARFTPPDPPHPTAPTPPRTPAERQRPSDLIIFQLVCLLVNTQNLRLAYLFFYGHMFDYGVCHPLFPGVYRMELWDCRNLDGV